MSVIETKTAFESGVDSKSISLGYKHSEVGLIPKEWDLVMLREICIDMLQGINTAIDKPEYSYSGVPILKANNVIDKVISIANVEHITKESYAKYNQRYNVKKGDFLFSNIGARLGTGALWEQDIEATFAWNVMRIIPNTKKVHPKFLAQLINSPKQSEKIQGEQSGSGMGFIPKSIMQRVLLPLPPVIEQAAIANALSDVDALIQELEKLIAKKQAIKTATMQQLLTGRTRLPQFAHHPDGRKKGYKPSELGEIPEDWEVKTVYELAGFQKNLFDDGDWVEAEHITDKGVRLIQTGNIGVGQFVEKNAKKYIFETSYEKLKCKQLQAGDLLICRLAEPAGRACILPDIGELKVITSVDVTIFRPNCELVSREFYNQYFASTDWFNLVLEQVGGTTHKRISRGALGRIAICNPSFEEQNEIATILGDMDKEIQSLEKRLFKTRQIKQGMMQELLTGKTRLVQPLNKESQHG